MREFLEKFFMNITHRVTLIENKERRGALANHWMRCICATIMQLLCILMVMIGFAHENVLARVNQEYQDNSVWLTDGQYIGASFKY